MRPWTDLIPDADRCQAKGDYGFELNVRRSAVRAALGNAVQMDQEAGLRWLRTSGVVAQAERVLVLAVKHEQVEDNLLEIDLALACSRSELARRLLATARPGYKFWKHYQEALVALLDGRPYTVSATLKARGWLATFVPHLELAAALASGQPIEEPSAVADKAFRRRNSDRRMFDPLGVDGDGQVPVMWDLRKHSILAAARLGGAAC